MNYELGVVADAIKMAGSAIASGFEEAAIADKSADRKSLCEAVHGAGLSIAESIENAGGSIGDSIYGLRKAIEKLAEAVSENAHAK